jgi:hypothetical protein
MNWEQLHPLVVEHLKETRWSQLEIRALVEAVIDQLQSKQENNQ